MIAGLCRAVVVIEARPLLTRTPRSETLATMAVLPGLSPSSYLACVSGELRPRRPTICTAPYVVRGVHAILPECIDGPGCHHEG